MNKKTLKKIKILIAIAGAAVLSYFIYQHCQASPNNSKSIAYAKEGQEAWTGPGFYYGFWFGSVAAYNNWWYQDHHQGKMMANNSQKKTQKQDASLSSRHAYRGN